MNSLNLQYKAMLDDYLEKRWHPLMITTTDRPNNAVDTVTYNKWCLSTYLKRLYESRDKAPLLVLKFEELQEQFIEKYYSINESEQLVMDARLGAIDDIRKLTGDKCAYAVSLYKALKSGREDAIFNRRYSTKSYEAFKQYALIYDLVRYKVFLEDFLPNLEPVYNTICFNLNEVQIGRLYRLLKGRFISDNTRYRDFRAVFTLQKIKADQPIEWIHMASRNKTQLNRSTLFHLIIKLNELKSYTGKHLKPEIFEFIGKSFADTEKRPLVNLDDAHRNYKNLKVPHTLTPISEIIDLVKAIKK